MGSERRGALASLATRARVAVWSPFRAALASRDVYVVRGRQQRLDHQLMRMFESLSTDCVLDVGANVGQYAALLRQAGWSGPIVSFEPVPATFATLAQARAHDDAWSGTNISCGDQDGTAVISHYEGASDLDSFRRPTDYGRERLVGLRNAPTSVEVPVRRLDGIWDEVVPATATTVHLKIDTQGSDLEVLEGARDRLDLIRSLQIELPAKPAYDGLPTLGQAVDVVMSMGFEAVAFFPVARDRDGLRAVEFDGLFVLRTSGSVG